MHNPHAQVNIICMTAHTQIDTKSGRVWVIEERPPGGLPSDNRKKIVSKKSSAHDVFFLFSNNFNTCIHTHTYIATIRLYFFHCLRIIILPVVKKDRFRFSVTKLFNVKSCVASPSPSLFFWIFFSSITEYINGNENGNDNENQDTNSDNKKYIYFSWFLYYVAYNPEGAAGLS